MRRLQTCAFLYICGFACSARAQDAAAAFRDFTTKQAAEESSYVESWWSANLDADAALERVAVLCPLDKDGRKGVFLIEKDAGHRWELTFDFDSRTNLCKGKPKEPPKLDTRKSGTIDLRQGHLSGYELTSYAIRVGNIVVIREENVEADGAKPVVKDWDALIKKKKEKAYQVPENLRSLNN
jgi:hypothetical protein